MATAVVLYESPLSTALTIAPPLDESSDAELAQLAERISREHDAHEREREASEERARNSVRHAIEAGNALKRAKDVVGHGKFMTWVDRNCPRISHATANGYMNRSGFAGELVT